MALQLDGDLGDGLQEGRGARVRAERLAAARRIVEVARGAGADFRLVAGDTFEDNGVDRVLVQKVADILGDFGGPVYVIPGNHDPSIPGSVWEHPAWKAMNRSASPSRGVTDWAPPCLDFEAPGPCAMGDAATLTAARAVTSLMIP